jgi:hypothetical protein
MAENYLDPAEDTPAPPVAQDTQSTDNSKSGVRKAWDAWQSKPENSAALLQFGIAMMQPRAQGQSSLGQFANALGEGSAASDRNVAIQEAQQDRVIKRDENQSMADYRKAQATAALKNADSYGRQVDQAPGGAGIARTTLSNTFRVQQGFRTWMAKAEDTMGLTADPLLGAVQKQFPQIKSKADLVSNPEAQRLAFKLYSQQFSTEPPDDTTTDPAIAAPPGTTPSAPGGQPQIKTYFDKVTGAPRQFRLDGNKWIPLE